MDEVSSEPVNCLSCESNAPLPDRCAHLLIHNSRTANNNWLLSYLEESQLSVAIPEKRMLKNTAGRRAFVRIASNH